MHPQERDWTSNRLDQADAAAERTALLTDRFAAALRDRSGRAPTAHAVLLEKTPKNSLRMPFAPQWVETTTILLDGLAALPPGRGGVGAVRGKV